MAQQSRANEAQSAKKNQPQRKPNPGLETLDHQTALIESVPGPLGAVDNPTIQAQANRLNDSRLPPAQRQALAGQIGRKQGNLHLQRVMASLRQPAELVEPAEPEAPYQSNSVEPASRQSADGVSKADSSSGRPVVARQAAPDEPATEALGEEFGGSGSPTLAPGQPPGENGHQNGHERLPVQRQETIEEEDKPTEAEKAAALAAAEAAEQSAGQSQAQGKNEIAKSKTEKAAEKQAGQAAQQKAVEAKTAVKEKGGEKGQAGAEGKAAAGEESKKKGKGSAGAQSGANGAGPGGAGAAGANGAGPEAAQDVEAKAPASPEEDPAFQAVVGKVKGVGAKEKAHAPAAAKAGEAQAAAESPAKELEGKAQANQVGEIEQTETPDFDAAAFKAQLMERIKALAPKTSAEADNFKDQNKLGGVKGEMQGKVQEEKSASQGPLEEKAAEAPDPASVEPKPVKPLPPAQPGSEPPDVGAQAAAPKPKGKSEVEKPLKENTKKIDQQMAEADVSEEQLANSNEPEFKGALDAKKEAKTHAAEGPQQYRQQEQEQLTQAETDAAATTQEKTKAMHGDRTGLLTQVEGQQGQTKSKDEKEREQVAAKIQGIYEATKGRVDKILAGLDKKVEQAFDAGAQAAKQAFEDFVDAKMEAFKEKRYGGWFGWAKWATDKLLGMPSEVNAFYQEGRQLYLSKMDAVIDNVVAIIGAGLQEAKAEIASGKQKIQEYVSQLPEHLQQVGQQAAQDIQGKFDELEENVDNKQSELIDTLANKYQENLQAVDARIDELKAANQGLVDKAINAVVGVIKTILELKNMLLNVLSKVADAVMNIIKDPIGFLGNLISGVKQGFQNFAANIGTHLKKGLMTWLFGAVAESGIQLPESFDLKGILSLVMNVLGLTWANIRGRAVKLFGEKVVGYLEGAFEIFKIIKDQGLGGLWEYIKDMLGDLKTMVIDAVKDMVITQVIQAGVQWLMGVLGGPAGAFIKAAKAIYDIVMWFINNGSRVMSLVNSIIESVGAIASGAVGQAAKFIEESLAKAIPIVISFLASLLGLGNIGQKVKDIIKKVQKPINKAIDWVLSKAKAVVKKVGGALGFGKEKEGKEGEVEAGKAALAREEKKYAQDGKISKENAERVAAAVQNKEAVFQSVQVVDGGDSWDYDYVVQRAKFDSKKTTKAETEETSEEATATVLIKRPPSRSTDVITDPNRMLPPAPPGTRTLGQVRNMPGGPKRGEAGEQFVSEAYHGAPREETHPVEVPTIGKRRIDVSSPGTGTLGKTQRIEVKTYKKWKTVEGKPQSFTVPLTAEIRKQIDKDTYLRSKDSAYEPVWIFIDAPPSKELSQLLSARNILVIVHS